MIITSREISVLTGIDHSDVVFVSMSMVEDWILPRAFVFTEEESHTLMNLISPCHIEDLAARWEQLRNMDGGITARKLASRLRLKSAQAANRKLAEEGYQVRISGYWTPTRKGMPYCAAGRDSRTLLWLEETFA
jgi:uncharacterized protein YmfQ (DUF2313 family)